MWRRRRRTGRTPSRRAPTGPRGRRVPSDARSRPSRRHYAGYGAPLVGARAWLAGGLVALAAFVVFAVSPVETVSDSRWALPASISLVRHGDVDLDEYRPII